MILQGPIRVNELVSALQQEDPDAYISIIANDYIMVCAEECTLSIVRFTNNRKIVLLRLETSSKTA